MSFFDDLPPAHGGCTCMCHRVPGVIHCMPCCYPEITYREVPTMKPYIDNWDDFWMGMAQYASQKSKDPSTKLGVVLVTPGNDLISLGWNGFPRGVRELAPGQINDGSGLVMGASPLLDPERWEKRPEKYRWVEHAERNAVFNAARLGRSTVGAIAYINADPTPCSDCTRALIQAGVVMIVGLDKPFTGKGVNIHYHCGDIENKMLDEAGVVRKRLPSRG